MGPPFGVFCHEHAHTHAHQGNPRPPYEENSGLLEGTGRRGSAAQRPCTGEAGCLMGCEESSHETDTRSVVQQLLRRLPIMTSWNQGPRSSTGSGQSVRLRLDGKTVIHKTKDEHCPGSGQQPSADAPLACWLPVKDGLTPHGLRHSHKTWMAEDGIPEILAEQRLGHEVPGMRGLYAHASQRMWEELSAALHARWEESLRERAAIYPHSPVPLLDNQLAPFRGASAGTQDDTKEAQGLAALGGYAARTHALAGLV
jgi:Phage integrase family